MGDGNQRNDDLYAVLGLKKECTESELRNAYKKLAMRWHPDRCSAAGNPKYVEEAKKKFQAIQQAYSVLSDGNKRLLYDVGVYDSDDGDDSGMGDFLSEMVAMMDQTKPNGDGSEDSLEKLQELFQEMINCDAEATDSSGSYFASSSFASFSECSSSSNKRNSSDMKSGKAHHAAESYKFESHMQSFNMGAGGERSKSRRKKR